MNYLDTLGVGEEAKDIKASSVGSSYQTLTPGIYDAVVKDWANYTSDKGANVVYINYFVQFKDEKGEPQETDVKEYVSIKSGDEKGNKILEFGIANLKARLFAIGEPDMKVRQLKMKIGQTERNVEYASGAVGSKVKLVIRNQEEDGEMKHFIDSVLTTNGEDSKNGKDALDKAKELIEKKPIKKPRTKVTQSAPTQGSAPTNAEVPSSWR